MMASMTEPPRLTEVQRSVSDWFQGGGSVSSAFLVIAAMAGALLIAWALSQRARRRDNRTTINDPGVLFDDLVGRLPLTPQQRHWIAAMVRELRLQQPAVVLLSPALFDRYHHEWTAGPTRSSTRARKPHASVSVKDVRAVLFPVSTD